MNVGWGDGTRTVSGAIEENHGFFGLSELSLCFFESSFFNGLMKSKSKLDLFLLSGSLEIGRISFLYIFDEFLIEGSGLGSNGSGGNETSNNDQTEQNRNKERLHIVDFFLVEFVFSVLK
jgi:hypothetical protein